MYTRLQGLISIASLFLPDKLLKLRKNKHADTIRYKRTTIPTVQSPCNSSFAIQFLQDSPSRIRHGLVFASRIRLDHRLWGSNGNAKTQAIVAHTPPLKNGPVTGALITPGISRTE
jgi:hypothetical protein